MRRAVNLEQLPYREVQIRKVEFGEHAWALLCLPIQSLAEDVTDGDWWQRVLGQGDGVLYQSMRTHSSAYRAADEAFSVCGTVPLYSANHGSPWVTSPIERDRTAVSVGLACIDWGRGCETYGWALRRTSDQWLLAQNHGFPDEATAVINCWQVTGWVPDEWAVAPPKAIKDDGIDG